MDNKILNVACKKEALAIFCMEIYRRNLVK